MGFFEDHRDTLTQASQAVNTHDLRSINICFTTTAFPFHCVRTAMT